MEEFFLDVMNVLIVFQNERSLFLKEHANKMYGITSYFLAKTFVELPFFFLLSIIHSSIYYFGVGLSQDFTKFVWFLLIGMSVTFSAGSVGFVCGTLVTDPILNISISPYLISPLLLVSGLVINLRK